MEQEPGAIAIAGRIFIIGASLTGIDAFSRLMGKLPADFPAPIFITQHIAPHSPGLVPHCETALKVAPSRGKHNALVERYKMEIRWGHDRRR